jgi:peptide chain release factor
MTETSLLLTAGTGPAECRHALKQLIGIIAAEARQMGVLAEVAESTSPDIHGPKSAVITLTGDGANAIARSYSGTVRLIFKSHIRPGHKRRNWFVGVMPVDLSRNEDDPSEIRPEDLRFETLRAGGPGGQHQNTTDSAVRATHLPTGLSVVARDDRSQHRNRSIAIGRIKALLRLLALQNLEDQKRQRFMANKELERGNAVKTIEL